MSWWGCVVWQYYDGRGGQKEIWCAFNFYYKEQSNVLPHESIEKRLGRTVWGTSSRPLGRLYYRDLRSEIDCTGLRLESEGGVVLYLNLWKHQHVEGEIFVII